MTESNYSISQATPDNTDQALQVFNQSLHYKRNKSDNAWGDAPFTADEVLAMIARGWLHLVYQGTSLVGCLNMMDSDKENWGAIGLDNKALYIHQLAVADGMHGQNIGTECIELVAKLAISQGKECLRLDCHSSNTGLCKYYESLGFQRRDSQGDGIALFERQTKAV